MNVMMVTMMISLLYIQRLIFGIHIINTMIRIQSVDGWVAPIPIRIPTTAGTMTTKSSSSSTQLFTAKNPKDNENNNKDGRAAASSSSPPPKKQTRSSESLDSSTLAVVEEEERPGEITGSQFFGGKELDRKAKLYDAEAEAAATIVAPVDSSSDGRSTNITYYDRFADKSAFPDELAKQVARSLQQQINSILYDDTVTTSPQTQQFTYASSSFKWQTPFPVKKSNPLQELEEEALAFYRHVDVAITSASAIENKNNKLLSALESAFALDQGSSSSGSNNMKLLNIRWEVAVQWPIAWDPRILLTGKSVVIVDTATNQITQQVDTLDDSDSTGDGLVDSIRTQILPKFWDLFHVGMTPVAEQSPRLPPPPSSQQKFNLLPRPYQLQCLPPRLYLTPTLTDTGSREDNLAANVPNHAFTCVIRTVGASMQRYVPVSPVEIQLLVPPATTTGGESSNKKKKTKLQPQWSIPLSVEYASSMTLPLPPPDEEAIPGSDPSCSYQFRPERLVATVPYAGQPQDQGVPQIRQQLYEAVVEQDGYTAKLDPTTGRPQFFFWQTDTKACYTSDGLGMVVYEWRPDFTKPAAIGIELELL